MNISAPVKLLSLLAFLNIVLLYLLNLSYYYFSRVYIQTLLLSNRVVLDLSLILFSLKTLLIKDLLKPYLFNIFSVSYRVILRILYYRIEVLVTSPFKKNKIYLIGDACKKPLSGIE